MRQYDPYFECLALGDTGLSVSKFLGQNPAGPAKPTDWFPLGQESPRVLSARPRGTRDRFLSRGPCRRAHSLRRECGSAST